MRHRKTGRKFNRTSSHRKAMFRNMVTSLFKHDRIRTTDAKAKELRSWSDHLITLAKRGDLHARRQALSIIREKEVVHKLFEEASERFGSISGGYTRIVKMGLRPGDAASMSLVELISAEKPAKGKKKAKTTKAKKAEPAKKTEEKKEAPKAKKKAVGKSENKEAKPKKATPEKETAKVEEIPVEKETEKKPKAKVAEKKPAETEAKTGSKAKKKETDSTQDEKKKKAVKSTKTTKKPVAKAEPKAPAAKKNSE
jgi:large subunit ribosomal protein L17